MWVQTFLQIAGCVVIFNEANYLSKTSAMPVFIVDVRPDARLCIDIANRTCNRSLKLAII